MLLFSLLTRKAQHIYMEESTSNVQPVCLFNCIIVPQSSQSIVFFFFAFMLCQADIVNCRGLALDWLSRNLYWLSAENDESQINVARFDGSLKTSIIHGIDKPRCLVVHPAKG